MLLQPNVGSGFGQAIEATFQAVESQEARSYAITTIAMPLFVVVAYVLLSLDRRREGSPVRDDGQLGLKVLLFGALGVAVLLAAAGTRDVLAFILGGFKGGWKTLRGPLATAISGGGIGAAIYFLLLPRTNHMEKPQVERIMVGMTATWLGAGALASVSVFLNAILAGKPWAEISDALASVGVGGGVTVLLLLRLGALSGWRAIPRVPPMPMAPPMSGGYPPQGPGQPMPPLGGGYPPASSGGYSPPGGGGGWPTQ
jgi:hypothetical protein